MHPKFLLLFKITLDFILTMGRCFNTVESVRTIRLKAVSMNKHQWLGIICGTVCAASTTAQTLIESFEYATDDELLAAWVPSANAVVTLSDSVAARATG